MIHLTGKGKSEEVRSLVSVNAGEHVLGELGADHVGEGVPTDRIGADHADAVQPGAVDRLEIFAEQLVQAADHEHRHTVGRK